MDNLNDLKAIWLSADTHHLPAADEIVRYVKKYRNQKLRKKALLIAIATILAGFEVAVMFFYKSMLWSTTLGESLMVLGCSIVVATNINSFNRMYGLKDLSNKEFVAFFERTRQRQIFHYTKTQVVCFAVSAAGLLLYLYEMVYKNTLWTVIIYGITLLYLAIMWLVVRPRMYKKIELKMNETMERINALSKQF